MGNIIKAEFARLFKGKIFYICLAFSGFFPLLRVLSKLALENDIVMANSANMSQGFQNLMFLYIGILASVFISLFVGRELTDGTIRNKLVYGYKKSEIYFAELIVCTCAVLIFQAAFTFMTVLGYTLFLSGMDSYMQSTAVIHLVGIFMIIVYCSLFLAITFIAGSRTAAAVASIITALVIMLGGQTVYQNVYDMNALSFDPENISPFAYSPGGGTTVLLIGDLGSPDAYSDFYEMYTTQINTPEKAVSYYADLTDSKRGEGMSGVNKSVYLLLNDILPSCQAEHLNITGMCLDPKFQEYLDGSMDYMTLVQIPIVPKRYGVYIAADVLLSGLLSAAGYFLFKRKDIN